MGHQYSDTARRRRDPAPVGMMVFKMTKIMPRRWVKEKAKLSKLKKPKLGTN
jgi:hypothetical protein